MANLPVLPRWAETAAGLEAANVTVPPSGQLDTGFTASEVPPSGYQNWFQTVVYKWVQLLREAFPFTGLGMAQILNPFTAKTPVANLQMASVSNSNGLAVIPPGFTTPSTLVCAGSSGTNDANVYTTQDGVTWTNHAHNLAGSDAPSCIGWLPFASLFVVVGNTSSLHAASSPDGFTWTARVGAGATGNNFALAVGSSAAVCGSLGGNTVITTSNGTTWTQATLAAMSSLRGVVWCPRMNSGAGFFLATGTSGTTANALYTSPDGINWTARTSPSANLNPPGYGDFQNAQFWPNVYPGMVAGNLGTPGNTSVAIISENTSGKLWSSPDGITWTALLGGSNYPLFTSTFNWAFWTGNLLLLGTLASSPWLLATADGINFFNLPLNTPGASANITGLAMFNGALWYATSTGTSTNVFQGGTALPMWLTGCN